MSSPAPLAKGRRSRKQTLGSENTETTLSSSAISQSASLARAAAGVGDRRYRFSSRSERRGKNPPGGGFFSFFSPPPPPPARAFWIPFFPPRPPSPALGGVLVFVRRGP